jgi:hypothetical protein
MRPFKSAIESAVLRALAAAADLNADDRQKPTMVVEEIRTFDWASVTFIGARHIFDLRFDGPPAGVTEAAAALAQRLPDWEFRIPGHIVADIELSGIDSLEASHSDPGEISNSGPSTASHSFVVNVLTIVD